MIITNKISVTDIHPEKLAELMRIILPNGQTLVNLLIKKVNLTELYKLIEIVHDSRSGNGKERIPFEMIPDIHGVTPLHECVKKTYTKAAEQILVLLGSVSLNNHSKYVLDVLPDLIETCPMAVANYLRDRKIECTWGIKQTKGNLKVCDELVEFGVFSYPFVYIDDKEIENKLFVKETAIQVQIRHGAEQKRLPMLIHVYDFPKLHHFNSKTGKELILALSESDDLSIFDRQYVQALLEYQWPAIRYAIMRDLFIPYILFLVAFNYYSLV